MFKEHREGHHVARMGWLRAAVLGANDGIISTAGLLIGVAAAHRSHSDILIAGVAGLIAGAMSMAAGEYISVSSQADTEKNELLREKNELENNTVAELEELTLIYVERGVERDLARKVAEQLMAKDALGAHARDELGFTEHLSARPIQAATFSGLSFTLGTIPPLLIAALTPVEDIIKVVVIVSILLLALLGAIAARIGGCNMLIGAARVLFWGSLAMLLSVSIGSLLGLTI